VTVALLGLATASYPLYLASSASGALALQVAQRCPDGLDASVTGSGPLSGTQAATDALDRRSDAALVSAGAGASDLQPPIVTLDATGIGVRAASRASASQDLVQIASRTGATANITVVSSAPGPGVWLPDDLASTLGAKAGSEVEFGQDAQGQQPEPGPGEPVAEVRVAGIYRSLVGTVLPRFWCTQSGIFGSFDSNFPPPPVVIAPSATLSSILVTMKVRDVSSYQWERTLAPGINLPEAQNVLAALEHLSASVGIAPAYRGEFVAPSIGGGLRGVSLVVSQLAFIVDHAQAIEQALRSGILPVSLAGLAVSALLVAAAGSYWVDRRRTEVALLSSRGAGPAALGAKAALENLIPVVIGALAGWAAASGVVVAIGPSGSLPSTSRLDGLFAALAGGGLALLLVWVVAGLRVRSSAVQRFGRSRLALVPFELVPLGFSIWAWSTLGQPSLQANGTSAPGVGASFLVFPILFLLSLAAVGARVTVIFLSARRVRRASAKLGQPAWLASRRLSGAARIAALSLASTAAAVGVLLYGSALTSSQNATLHAKAAVFVGSTSSVQLASPGPVPPDLASSTTEVLTLPNAELGGQGVDVIGVDPKTFARAAFWDSSFSGESLQKLLSRISGTDDPGAPLPVIVAGNGAASVTGTLRLSDFGLFTAPIAVNVVDTAKEFPGQNGNAPLVVTSTSLLQKFGVPGLVQLWSTQPDQQVLASVERAGETPTILVTLSDVLDQTTFAAIAWTFDYLQALGVLSGAVIIGGLLLFVSTRARSRALAYVLSRRMGLRRSTHFLSLLTELAFLIGPGAVLGGAVGWTAVELAQPHLNPLPALNPPPLIEVPWPTVAAAVVTALVVWASISGWAQHVADGSRASELLRADD
jgi:putative ABC transport system permease protein